MNIRSIVEIAQFTQAAGFAREVFLLHLDRQRLPIGLLGLFQLPGFSVYHPDLMPDTSDSARFAQGLKGLPRLSIDLQGLGVVFLPLAQRAEIGFADGCPPAVIELLIAPDSFFIRGSRFIVSP